MHMGSSTVLQVDPVRGDDHAARGRLLAHLLGGQVRLALAHRRHLRRDDAGARALSSWVTGVLPGSFGRSSR